MFEAAPATPVWELKLGWTVLRMSNPSVGSNSRISSAFRGKKDFKNRPRVTEEILPVSL